MEVSNNEYCRLNHHYNIDCPYCTWPDTIQVQCVLWMCKVVLHLTRLTCEKKKYNNVIINKYNTYHISLKYVGINVILATKMEFTNFFAGTVLWRFHNFSVWSSLAVMRTGSVGWKTSALTASKCDRNVYFAFHVFLKVSFVVETICWTILRTLTKLYQILLAHYRNRILSLHHMIFLHHC